MKNLIYEADIELQKSCSVFLGAEIKISTYRISLTITKSPYDTTVW